MARSIDRFWIFSFSYQLFPLDSALPGSENFPRIHRRIFLTEKRGGYNWPMLSTSVRLLSRFDIVTAASFFLLNLLSPILPNGAQNIPKAAQSPPECVTLSAAATDPVNRTLQLEIVNACPSALTALSWEIACPGISGDRAQTHSERLDFFPSIGLEPWTQRNGGQAIGGVAPGSSHQRTVVWPCRAPGNPGNGAAIQAKAFLLADRTVWGDREELRRIMHARSVELAELRYWTGLLEGALRENQTARQPLRFEALEARSRIAQYHTDPLGSLVAGGVQKDLIRALRAAPENRGESGILAPASVQRILMVYRHMMEEKSRHVFDLD